MSDTTKKFSVALLTKEENERFKLSDFNAIKNEEKEDIESEGKVVQNFLIKKDVLDNRFLALCFESGAVKPRPPIVYNTELKNNEENPRSDKQIERNDQSFFLFDVETQKFFLSDFRKKLTIQEWLRKKLNKIVIIKNIIDQEDFLKNVVEIKSIYLSSVPDLFSRMGFLREILDDDVNNFGTAINNVELTVHFTKNNLPVKLIEKIKYFIRQKESGAFKKLQITGRSDEVFDRVFNTDGIIDKVSIIVPQSDSGLLDSKIVFSRLIEKIK